MDAADTGGRVERADAMIPQILKLGASRTLAVREPQILGRRDG